MSAIKNRTNVLNDSVDQLSSVQADPLEESLIRRAMGYDVEETEVVATKDGRPIKVRKTKRHIPGSIEACKLLIRYRKQNAIQKESTIGVHRRKDAD